MTEDSGVLPKGDDADELEQVRDYVPQSDEGIDPQERPLEANEADVVEQTRAVPLTDEDESLEEE